VAFAHGVCKSNGEEEYKKALMYPISYKVTDEQIKKSKELRLKRQKEVLKENKNNLLFCGMGMNFKSSINDRIGNHRIRTEFLNSDGIKCFIEVGTGGTSEDNLRIDHAIFEQVNNYKNLERETFSLKYTYKNVLNLVNKYFNCNFKKIVMDYYNIRCYGVLCESPKIETEQEEVSLRDYLNIFVVKLNYCESKRLKKEGFTNECFFNEDGSLTENYEIRVLEKQKYFYINFGTSGAFMVNKREIKGFPAGSVFNIKGYGTPNFNKWYGDIKNLLPETLHNLRYDYRR